MFRTEERGISLEIARIPDSLKHRIYNNLYSILPYRVLVCILILSFRKQPTMQSLLSPIA